MELTEKDAATAFARAWNRLDCREFLELLAEDAHYASQWVFNEMENKKEIAEYLTGKMQTVKNTGSKVYAELGKIGKGFPGRDCVLMAQDVKKIVKAVVLFEVSGNTIKRIDLCMPQLFDPEGSGIYPI